ncbi:MAG: hypothetical protein ACRDJU_12545, partial [Actinomycetota bacterium]
MTTPERREEYARYRSALAEALGSEDPLAVLEQALAEIGEAVRSAAREALTLRPSPDEWSPQQVLSHLLDAEILWGVRVRMVLTA